MLNSQFSLTASLVLVLCLIPGRLISAPLKKSAAIAQESKEPGPYLRFLTRNYVYTERPIPTCLERVSTNRESSQDAFEEKLSVNVRQALPSCGTSMSRNALAKAIKRLKPSTKMVSNDK